MIPRANLVEAHGRKCQRQHRSGRFHGPVLEFAIRIHGVATGAEDDLISSRIRCPNELRAVAARALDIQIHDSLPDLPISSVSLSKAASRVRQFSRIFRRPRGRVTRPRGLTLTVFPIPPSDSQSGRPWRASILRDWGLTPARRTRGGDRRYQPIYAERLNRPLCSFRVAMSPFIRPPAHD
jgi:hypothetical protein